MGRKERPIDPGNGPVATFAAALRALRAGRGLTYEQMARRVHVAKTVLSEAAGGVRAPSWPAVQAYLTAIDVIDPAEHDDWYVRWWRMRAAHAQATGRAWAGAQPPDPRR